MCDWTMAIGAALSFLGQQQQAQAQEEAADRQQAALNAEMERQDAYSRQAEQKALDNAGEYKAENRQERFEQARENAGESLVDSLVKSRESAPVTAQASGKISDAFTADRANKMADQFQKSVDMARMMGRMRGAQDMLGNEAITNADYASQLGIIGRNARWSYNAAQPGINAAGQVDPDALATGGLLQGLGGAIGSGSLSSAFGATPTQSISNGALSGAANSAGTMFGNSIRGLF